MASIGANPDGCIAKTYRPMSQPASRVDDVRDQDLVSGREQDVVVVLQDGRQLDGWLVRYEYLMRCEHVVFEPWQVDGIYWQYT